MSNTTSYNNDKVVTGEVEYAASDPASGAFFQPDYKKNDDLKLMLDGSKDTLKLEAMKRIIGMIAKGRDASDLFPAVVKNVVSKNIEVKKLVYVYLVRYAEEQQDLALLSISTFQRALKDPNQLIRASALRVLSSIRVPMIVPIVMLAIRDSASDMSPYVRKTAAHAIPKLYSLDPDQKEELVSILDKLLSDKAPLVVGSAAMAFTEVCGDRMSLIHRSYRKLCSLLADVDEWGQLALLNVLTVYAKTCFPDPNSETYSSDSDTDKPFYESEDSSGGRGGGGRGGGSTPSLDPDHRLLLRAAKPLLQSRNSGVVMAVAQLFYHCGPVQELPPVAKAMVRLLRAPIEVQSVVLNSIASLTVTKRSLFEPFLKSFFVRNSDPTHIKLLKLEILTNLATEASAGVVLREFQTYVGSSDRAFAAATIHAIGRLAVNTPHETETCLNGLLHLLSSKDEWVVCEAVVVVKRVVGGGAASARAAVARAAKLLRADRLATQARAAAVWLVAEHGAAHPRAAAILAHMAMHFADQEELVKLQVVSLAVKLSVTQPATLPVCRYVLSLARYDVSYDVRDRARLLRRFVEPAPGKQLPAYAAQIFCPDKPKPTVESSFKERGQYTVGTLSQYLGLTAAGYRALPPAPRTPAAAHLRTPPDEHAPDAHAERGRADQTVCDVSVPRTPPDEHAPDAHAERGRADQTVCDVSVPRTPPDEHAPDAHAERGRADQTVCDVSVPRTPPDEHAPDAHAERGRADQTVCDVSVPRTPPDEHAPDAHAERGRADQTVCDVSVPRTPPDEHAPDAHAERGRADQTVCDVSVPRTPPDEHAPDAHAERGRADQTVCDVSVPRTPPDEHAPDAHAERGRADQTVCDVSVPRTPPDEHAPDAHAERGRADQTVCDVSVPRTPPDEHAPDAHAERGRADQTVCDVSVPRTPPDEHAPDAHAERGRADQTVCDVSVPRTPPDEHAPDAHAERGRADQTVCDVSVPRTPPDEHAPDAHAERGRADQTVCDVSVPRTPPDEHAPDAHAERGRADQTVCDVSVPRTPPDEHAPDAHAERGRADQTVCDVSVPRTPPDEHAPDAHAERGRADQTVCDVSVPRTPPDEHAPDAHAERGRADQTVCDVSVPRTPPDEHAPDAHAERGRADQTVCDVSVPRTPPDEHAPDAHAERGRADQTKDKSFYSEPESSGSGSSSSSSSGSSSSGESSEGEESPDEKKKEEKPVAETNNYRSSHSGTSDSESDSASSSSSATESDEGSDESAEETPPKNSADKKVINEKSKPKQEVQQKKNEKSNLELLLELDEVASTLPTMTPTCGGFLSPPAAPPSVGIGDVDSITPVGPSLCPGVSAELFPRVVSGGLAATRRWSRAPHLYSHRMCAIEITFTNHSAQDVQHIRVNKKTLTGSRAIHDFSPVPGLAPGASASATLGVDFADSIQPIEFTIISSLGEVAVSVTPPVGELMRAVTMSETRWDLEHKKLRGMTECDKKATKLDDEQTICKRVFETANVAAITATGDFLRFAGRMMSSQDLVLISVKIESECSRVVANCSNMAIASLLANEVAQAFARS
ncbi:AP-3 complex subunit beta-2 isoform X2 [Manduca sexta]|uniref:AP-3 complex subunit beta-2 isoform X2 n=1 Tax=Manduca sexta TaxID=7130 RepID=UPI00188F2FAC|nr:AP-3 complex subunit beta-2 isoform X2 [Manduca sexta]